jgi:paraquat-inducible protein B
MNETRTKLKDASPEPPIRRSRSSVVWILLIAAFLVAAWLGYTTLAERVPTITLTFKTAGGLEAGKTQITHHDITLGEAKLEMESGSRTKEEREVSGTTYLLTAEKIGSVGPGSPMLFRGIEVGQVISSTFDGIDKGFTIRVFVQKPYDAFVHEHSQFWSASGINLSTEGGGFKVELQSLQAVLSGGIAFDTSEAARQGEPAKADTVFALYDDRAAAVEAGYTKRLRFLVEFEGSLRGLDVGAPVELKGMKIGQVVDFHLVVDAAKSTVRVPVVCEIDLARTNVINQPPDQVGKGILIEDLVKLGLRAQLRSSNLITGQLLVAVDFFPNAPPAEIVGTGPYPQLPTMPSELETVSSITRTLDKMASLPLSDFMQDTRKTLDEARQLMTSANAQATPLLASLRETSTAADSVLKSMGAAYGSGSQIRSELASLLTQLQETLRSAQMLANYLEQHPESLIRGKSASK